MLNITDIIALAKQGYKPSDIKELLELGQAQADEPKPDEEPAKDDKPDEKEKIPDENPEPEKKDPAPDDTEALKAEIVSLNDKIKELQRESVKKDISGDKLTDEQKFEELVKNFY